MSTKVKQSAHRKVTRETVCKTRVDITSQFKPGTGNLSSIAAPLLIDAPATTLPSSRQQSSQDNKQTAKHGKSHLHRSQMSKKQDNMDGTCISTSEKNHPRTSVSGGMKQSARSGKPKPSTVTSPNDRTCPRGVREVNRADNDRDNDKIDDAYEYLVEQDIAFINIPNDFELSKSQSRENGTKVNRIDPDEILLEYHESDPGKVYEISLHASHIAVIEKLETFKKLRSLDLSCNSINKMENLHSNTDLRELKLYGNDITVIENLEKLKELSNLLLQHNRIKSIGKGLSRFSKLSTVRLDSNLLLKLEPAELVGCVNIRYLDLSNNMLDNIQAVNSLPNLEELYISNNRLRNLGDIGRCTKLQELDVSGNRLEDLTGLVKLTNLQILNVARNSLKTLKSLGTKTKLEELDVSKNSISSLCTFPDQFPCVEILNISDNDLESSKEVKYFRHLNDLTELWLDGSLPSHDDSVQPYTSLDIQDILPQLDMLDGVSLRKQTSKPVIPVMRPMTSMGMISMRQTEMQLINIADDLTTFHKDMTNRFDTVRHVYQAWPAEDPTPRQQSSPPSGSAGPQICRPSTGSNRNRRSRIFEAQVFAAEHFADAGKDALPAD